MDQRAGQLLEAPGAVGGLPDFRVALKRAHIVPLAAEFETGHRDFAIVVAVGFNDKGFAAKNHFRRRR